MVIVGVTEPEPPVNVVAGTEAAGATGVTAGQVNAQVRVNGEPATVGVAVSVQDSEPDPRRKAARAVGFRFDWSVRGLVRRLRCSP